MPVKKAASLQKPLFLYLKLNKHYTFMISASFTLR
jgi:hypothetical protein